MLRALPATGPPHPTPAVSFLPTSHLPPLLLLPPPLPLRLPPLLLLLLPPPLLLLLLPPPPVLQEVGRIEVRIPGYTAPRANPADPSDYIGYVSQVKGGLL